MTKRADRHIELTFALETHPLRLPFNITGYTFTSVDVVVVSLRRGPHVGRGEAAGVYYLDDSPADIMIRVADVRPEVEQGIDHQSLQALVSGGTRNALDCALWDLEAKESGVAVWRAAGLDRPRPLLTTWTIGAAEPEEMARLATHYAEARALKLKLTGDDLDATRVRAVRSARPDVWLGVDANQGLTENTLERLLPVLVGAEVKLLEQPFKVGEEEKMGALRSPIPIAADESVQGLEEVRRLIDKFDVFNIKLDKCGGLTEALSIAHEVRRRGKRAMVGNMVGTSLAMAPAFMVGQLCEVVDLDGPLLLAADRPAHASYVDGYIECPESVWGGAARAD